MNMRPWSLVASMLLLAGVPTMAASAEAPDTVNGNGGVIVRVLSNTATASRLFRNWGELDIVRLEDEAAGKSNVFNLSPAIDAASHTALFAGALPVGHYRIGRLYSNACGWLTPCRSAWITLNPAFSHFEVRAGQLSDLGVLVQTPVSGKGNSYTFAHETDPSHEQVSELVQKFAPTLAPLLAQPMPGWDAATVSPGMRAQFARAISDSYGVIAPAAEADGFIAGSLNGVVFEWHPNGTWDAHDTGVRGAIESVLAADGQWLAGGEYSAILRSIDGGSHWTSLRGDLPLGLVGDLALWHGQVIATLLHGKTVSIHALQPDTVGSPHWIVLAEYPLKLDGYWASEWGDRPRSFLAGDRLVTSLPVDHVAVLDLVTRHAEVRESPSNINWMTASPDGAIHLRTQGSFLGVTGYESLDQAKSWKKIDDQGVMKPPAIRADGHGVGFRGGFTVLMGKVSDGKFVTTADGGASWTAGDKTTELFSQFLYSADGKVAWGITATGEIWHSEDDGQHWVAMP